MSAIGAVAGGNPGWAAPVKHAASHAAKPVAHDGDHGANKPAPAGHVAKDTGVSAGKLNIKA